MTERKSRGKNVKTGSIDDIRSLNYAPDMPIDIDSSDFSHINLEDITTEGNGETDMTELNEQATLDNLVQTGNNENVLDVSTIDLNTVDLGLYTQEQAEEIIEHMSGKQVALAMRRAETKVDSKPVQVEKPKVVPFGLFRIKDGTKISIADLVALDKTPIKDAVQGMRPLDRDNVQTLLATYESRDQKQIDKIPPMKLQGSTIGTIVVAGYHRWEAQRLAVLNTFMRNPMMLHEGKMTQAAHKLYEEALKNFYVKYEVVNATEQELPTIAYMDNFDNGLKPDEKGRSNFGLYLYRHYKEIGQKKNWDEIATIVKVTRQAMNQQKLRNDESKGTKRTVKIADSDLLPEDKAKYDEFLNAHDQSERPDMLEGLFKRVINAALKLANEQISPSELNGYIQNMITTREQCDAVNALSLILIVEPPKVAPKGV